MWKRVLREYFAFPKKERRGLWVLFIIWLILLSYRIYLSGEYKYLHSDLEYSIIVSEEFKKQDLIRDTTSFSTIKKNNFRLKPFKYLNEYDFEQIGLSSQQIKIIKEIQEKNIPMFTQSNFIECKQLDTVLKQRIYKYIKFYPEKKYFFKTENISNSVILKELNLVDSLELDAIKGISLSLSKRIIVYREKLGGFISHEQLKEVWGIDSFSYVQLVKHTTIDTTYLSKININKADIDQLGRHPYIGYKLGKLIINYRIQHGEYKKNEDLLMIKVMNENIFSKIESYISVEK